MEDNGRRRSSVSSLDKQNLARLQKLRVFQKGGLGSKMFKVKAGEQESAASALSKVMTRKKAGEALSLQIEIETETQWKILLRREGLIVVEVYAGWAGPCSSMVSLLKKVKVDVNDDRLTLATANSDNIPDLIVFNKQSEPAWIFFGSGKPVRLIRGTNAPKILGAIKSEFEHELLCMEGKAKRNLISISDEADRRKQAEEQAIRLSLEDKEKQAATMRERNEKNNTDVLLSKEESATVEKNSIVFSDQRENEQIGIKGHEDEERRSDSNVRLKGALEKYTIIALQNYLLETGAVTEIKDSLKNEFQIIQERYIVLQEDGVRRLFGIPYEIQVEVEEEEEPIIPEPEDQEECEESHIGESGIEGSGDSNLIPKPSNLNKGVGESSGSRPESRIDHNNKEPGENDIENEGDEEENQEPVEVVKVPKFESIPIPLPDELVGDTLLFLLESLQVRKHLEEEPEKPLIQTADDYIAAKVGPVQHTDALKNAPNSLHAIYGREEHASGVWCCRDYDDKRYVMLNFFPKFVTEILMPPPKEVPKYIVAIFPNLFANEIMENPELLNNTKDIIAQSKVEISLKLLERMLKSKGLSGPDLDSQKKSLTGFDMFAVSVNEKNPMISSILASLEPLHMSVDNENGKYETSQLFPHLNVLIDEPFEDEEGFYKDLLIDKFFNRSNKFKLKAILDDEALYNLESQSQTTSAGALEDSDTGDASNTLLIGSTNGSHTSQEAI